MSPATLTPPRPAEHERPAGPPSATVAAGDRSAAVGSNRIDRAIVLDPEAVDAARDAVARYLGALGLAVNSRPAAAAATACLDAALAEVGPQAGPVPLTAAALRYAALGACRWLGGLSDRGPTPPRHAAVAARLTDGRTPAVPAERRRPMTPQRFV